MEIKPLTGIDEETLFSAFSEAFATYELQIDRHQLLAMLRRRGFDPSLSFAAFDAGDIAAFTFNGAGMFNGCPTVYDTGTGTLPRYRGQGLATRIFEFSIPHLRQAGYRQYLLEVLQHNTSAVSVYRKLGFEVTREFNYYIQNTGEVRNLIPDSALKYRVANIELSQFDDLPDMWDFYPSWQNSFESVARAHGNFVYLGAFEGDKLVGYCVFEPASGDITQLAVDRNHRRRGVGSSLLREMLDLNRAEIIKAVNTDTGCRSIDEFFRAKNIILKGKQFEMTRTI